MGERRQPNAQVGPDSGRQASAGVRDAGGMGRRLGWSVAGLRRFTAAAARGAGVGGEITVRITSDRVVRELNRQFRGVDAATDVLSFPAAVAPLGDGRDRPAPGGDLAISWQAAERQARGQGHAIETELRVLILHGVLHLAGYDHERDRGQMRRAERRLQRRLGLPAGLISRSGAPAAGERAD